MLTTNALPAAPGAAMGGSFPGIIVPAAKPIKRATVRQLVRPGVRILGQRTLLQVHVAPAGTAHAWRTRSMERNYSGHDNVA